MGVFKLQNKTLEPKKSKHYTIEIDDKIKNDETILERLIFENTNLFPVDDIAKASTWIPLATQVDIDNHGTLDIIATDDTGTIYIVECKLKYNTGDMKTIRGQITDYASGLWSKHYSEDSDDSKFDIFWTWFCETIENRSDSKQKLEVILENAGADVEQTIDMMQNNFKDNKMTLVYVVDRMTRGIRDAVEWHNIVVNPKNNYPTFALEVRKYFEENDSELIVTQTFPLDLRELQRKIGTKSKRVKNDKQSWTGALKRKNLDDEDKIMEFANKLEELVKKDGGQIDWGSGAISPNMMPKFTNYPERSGLGLLAGGELVLQYHLIQGIAEYEDTGKEWEKRIGEIDDIKKEMDRSKSGGYTSLKLKTWYPHSDNILSILEELFVKNS